MRDMVRSYFANALDAYIERLNNTGWPDRHLELLKRELDVYEDAIGGFVDLSDLYLDGGTVEGFRASAELSDADWAESEPDLRDWMRKVRREHIKGFLSHSERLEDFSFTRPEEIAQGHHRPVPRL